MSDITIVTAFFDIGRGNSSIQYANTQTRTADTYLSYFEYLAQLDNDMIIFTSPEFEQKILELRQGKPTQVLLFDFKNKLQYHRQWIQKIQDSTEFKQKINPRQRDNIEYRSADYVLITNMKAFFVNRAINANLVKTKLVAWVDFGYCRSVETLANVKRWQFDFNTEKVHFFSINKRVGKIDSLDKVLDFIFNNRVYIIGGVMVATPQKWQQFVRLLHKNQKELLKMNVIDDDQGLFIMCLWKYPTLFQINFLGKKQWFSLFRKYDQTSKISFIEKIKDLLGK